MHVPWQVGCLAWLTEETDFEAAEGVRVPERLPRVCAGQLHATYKVVVKVFVDEGARHCVFA